MLCLHTVTSIFHQNFTWNEHQFDRVRNLIYEKLHTSGQLHGHRWMYAKYKENRVHVRKKRMPCDYKKVSWDQEECSGEWSLKEFSRFKVNKSQSWVHGTKFLYRCLFRFLLEDREVVRFRSHFTKIKQENRTENKNCQPCSLHVFLFTTPSWFTCFYQSGETEPSELYSPRDLGVKLTKRNFSHLWVKPFSPRLGFLFQCSVESCFLD